MTQIGVGIGTNKSPARISLDKQNHSTRKIDSTTGDDFDDEDPQNLLTQSVINTQNSSNSSDQRRIGGGDDDNSNSYESHSDFDFNHPNEKKSRTSNNSADKSARQKNRRGMSVNWGSCSTAGGLNSSSTMTNTARRYRSNRGQTTQKYGSNVKFFATSMAQSLYRNPIRLSGLSSTLKTKGTSLIINKNSPQTPTNQPLTLITLTTVPSEPELTSNRVFPPPQPRPESLAIMSEELFHERLKARHSPLLPIPLNNPSSTLLTVNKQLSTNFPSTSSFLLDKHCIEDVTYSTTNQFVSTNSDQINKNQTTSPPPSSPEKQPPPLLQNDLTVESFQEEKQEKISSPVKTIMNYSADSSDESWRLLNSNSSLDEHIPYIDETDFEDLGKKKKTTTTSDFLVFKKTNFYNNNNNRHHFLQLNRVLRNKNSFCFSSLC
jgi:hypothetical protein